MSYNVEDIDKIVSFTSWSDKKKIDKLLEIDADLYCNLGTRVYKDRDRKCTSTVKKDL